VFVFDGRVVFFVGKIFEGFWGYFNEVIGIVLRCGDFCSREVIFIGWMVVVGVFCCIRLLMFVW